MKKMDFMYSICKGSDFVCIWESFERKISDFFLCVYGISFKIANMVTGNTIILKKLNAARLKI